MPDLRLTRPGARRAATAGPTTTPSAPFHDSRRPSATTRCWRSSSRGRREDPDAPAVLSIDAEGESGQPADGGRTGPAASRRAARAFLAAGLGKGDRVFVMLPRVPEWYAALLGAMRIGAVPMPGPTCSRRTTSPTASSGRTRAPRSPTRSGAAKVDEAGIRLDAPLLHRRGQPPDGWLDFNAACEIAGDGETRQDPTHRDDPLLLYFTSGTVSLPKMVEHRQDYALGHVGTARFWHDLRPGDLHWTVTDTGWAKAAWGGLFGQFHERACVVQVALGKPDADTILGILAAPRRHLLLRAADALPAARPGRPHRARPQRAAPLHERRRAAQPRGDPRLEAGDRADDLRRLRPDRDDLPGRQLPRAAGAARLDGQARARLGRRRRRRRRRPDRRPARSATSSSCTTTPHQLGLFLGYDGDPRGDRGGRSAARSTSPATRRPRTRTATSGSRAAATT